MRTLWIFASLILGCGGTSAGAPTGGEPASSDPQPADTAGAADTEGKSADELRRAYDEKYEPQCAIMHERPETDAQRLVVQGPDADVDVERGTLEKAQIKRVMDSHEAEIRRCYDELHAWWPEAEGTVQARFGIGVDGSVIGVKVMDNDVGIRTLGCCLVGVVNELQFPSPEGDGVVIVNYPFKVESEF